MKITRLAMIPFTALALAGGLAAEERTFQVGPGGSLNVDIATGGSIEIKGSTAGQVNVKWEIVGRDTEGIRVEAYSTGERVRVSSAYVDGSRSSSVNLWISVPNRFDLDLQTGGGNISITNVEGKITGGTMGGNLTLGKLKGDLRVSTKGGNISLADSDVDGKASTMGGNIIIKNVAGNVNASTMGGNVVLDNVVQRGGRSINKTVDVSTMGGNIEVANAPHGAKVETKGGNIIIKKASEFIDAETMGGNITVYEHDGRVNAHTMGGNVSATIIPGGADQSIDISSMGGRIELTLPSAFSGEFDLELAYTRRNAKAFQIVSDFPIHQEETPEWNSSRGDARKYIRGTGAVGGGANKVRIRTVNGDIVIKKK
jgi:DUF4097 and DUF4098 domain-containing protein YvlB